MSWVRAGMPALAVACVALLAACGGGHVGRPSASRASSAGSQANADHVHRRTAVPDGDWTTFDYNAQRSGSGPASTGITAANAAGLIRRAVQIDGVADSSAIQLHAVRVRGRVQDVAILTTTYGRTIALDPGTGAKLWEFVPSDIGSYQGSPQITTASPVADPDRQYVYAASPDGVIHKLEVANGRQVWARRITFNPAREKIAGSLNISGSYVVAVTGGYFGDQPVYEGHVALIDRASGRLAHVFNAECSNVRELLDPPSSCRADTTFGGSAIWAREGAVVEPGSGRLLVATGNGPFNGATNWGDSVLELSPDAGRLLHNWTPADQSRLNSSDLDLGSTEPALLPGGLAVQGGKDGILRLLNLKRLDGTAGGPSARTGGELQRLAAPGPTDVFTAPAVWTDRGRTYVFVADNAGTAAYALRGGRLSVVWADSTPGTSPVVAGGLLYVYDQIGGTLRILRPASGRLIASLPAAPGHWSSPIVIGGRVILPVGGSVANNATSGTVFIYHLAGR